VKIESAEKSEAKGDKPFSNNLLAPSVLPTGIGAITSTSLPFPYRGILYPGTERFNNHLSAGSFFPTTSAAGGLTNGYSPSIVGIDPSSVVNGSPSQQIPTSTSSSISWLLSSPMNQISNFYPGLSF
jgi:hypothetical protein